MIKIFQFLSLVLLFLFSDSQTLLLAEIDGCEKHWIWDGFCDSGFFLGLLKSSQSLRDSYDKGSNVKKVKMVRLQKLLPHIQGQFFNDYVSQSRTEFSAPRESLLLMLFPCLFLWGKRVRGSGKQRWGQRNVGRMWERVKVGGRRLV